MRGKTMPTGFQAYIYLVLSAAIGFLLKILHGKLTEKKVSLIHELNKPDITLAAPPLPKMCIQRLTIRNTGNLAANNLRVIIKAELFAAYNVEYLVLTDAQEKCVEERKDTILTLTFQKLLPHEDILIVFSSKEPILHEIVLAIKSDEALSKMAVSWIGISTNWIEKTWVRLVYRLKYGRFPE
jgi:hypothetical protein